MAGLEVEVMLKDHPHIFIMDIESVLESPNVGDKGKCTRCGHEGTISRVGIPGRKTSEEDGGSDSIDNGQTSMFEKKG